MSALIFPGEIPGVLLRGSPVVRVEIGLVTRGVVVAAFASRVWVAWEHSATRAILGIGGEHPATLALDLADRTGRAHLEWWIEEQTGIQIKRDYSLHASGPSVHFGPWFSEFEPDVVWGKVDGVERILTPGLAALRPVRGANWRSDLLPDGSIRDDVDALRIVGLHVAGLGAP